MSSWLVCIDIDGTLLNGAEQVAPYTREVLQRFRHDGNKVALVTGRHPLSAFPIKEACGEVDGLGCFNGSWVLDSADRLIHSAFFTELEKGQIANELRDLEAPIIWATSNILYTTGAPILRQTEQQIVPIIKGLPPSNEVVLKVTVQMKNEKMRQIVRQFCEKLTQFEWIESSAFTIDFIPRGQSKGLALEKLATSLTIPLSRTIAIGNYDNDVSMIEKAKIGVAVANGSSRILQAANEIAGHHDELGVANWLAARCKSRLQHV